MARTINWCGQPSPFAQVSLPVALSSAGLARDFLREHWCAEHDSADLAQAQLIVTELVTNAVRHGGPPIELQVECVTTGGVILSVSDGFPDVPVAQAEDHARWGGHGVALVDLLSAEWGVHHHLDHQHRRRLHDEHQNAAQYVARDVPETAEDLPAARGGSERQVTTAPREHRDHRLFSANRAVIDSPEDPPTRSARTSPKTWTGSPAKTVWCRLVA